MIETITLAISGGFAMIGICSLIIAMLVMRRSKEAGTGHEFIGLIQCAGPIARLEFEDSLKPELFARAAEEESLAQAQSYLRGMVPDAAVATLQGLRSWLSQSDLVVAASPEATRALREGTAYIQRHSESGRLLGHVVDRDSGKIIEVMKEVGRGRKVIEGIAVASTIAVSAAHMISSADLARTLKLVDKKLDLLLEFRRIDKEAKLERIYASAKELLAVPLDQMRRMEVWRLRGELRELRIGWRREIEYHLKQIENPKDAAWIDRVFTFQSTSDQRIADKISGGMVQLAMLEYSLRIDRILAASSDTWTESEATVIDELNAIERVGVLLREKASFITHERRQELEPVIEGIAHIVSQHRALIWARPDVEVIEDAVNGKTVPLLAG